MSSQNDADTIIEELASFGKQSSFGQDFGQDFDAHHMMERDLRAIRGKVSTLPSGGLIRSIIRDELALWTAGKGISPVQVIPGDTSTNSVVQSHVVETVPANRDSRGDSKQRSSSHSLQIPIPVPERTDTNTALPMPKEIIAAETSSPHWTGSPQWSRHTSPCSFSSPPGDHGEKRRISPRGERRISDALNGGLGSPTFGDEDGSPMSRNVSRGLSDPSLMSANRDGSPTPRWLSTRSNKSGENRDSSPMSRTSQHRRPSLLGAQMMQLQEAKPLPRRPIRNVHATEFLRMPRLKEGLKRSVSFSPRRIGEIVEEVVQSASFDYLSASFVIINAATIGMQTDHMAQGLLEKPDTSYRVAELMFCFVFTLELALRITAYGRRYFSILNPDFKWNMFDFILVMMQIMDEVLTLAFSGQAEGSDNMNFSFLRILRILRLIKIMRVIRILRLVQELRAIVSSILGSLKSLLWTVVLLFLLVYIFAVFLTQQVLDHRVNLRKDAQVANEFDKDLSYYFGSLGRSIFSLYQAITGGEDWDSMANPLMQRISVMLGLVLAFYTAFALLALMNVVTGVFVEAALETAKKDRSSYMLRHTRELFTMADPSNTGVLDWDRFQASLEGEFMQEFFQAIEIDPSEAQSIFSLLDVDDSGTIDLDEFLNGCLSLHGPAKAIHLATLMYETRLGSKIMSGHIELQSAVLAKIAEEMGIDNVDMNVLQDPNVSRRRSFQGSSSMSSMNFAGGASPRPKTEQATEPLLTDGASPRHRDTAGAVDAADAFQTDADDNSVKPFTVVKSSSTATTSTGGTSADWLAALPGIPEPQQKSKAG